METRETALRIIGTLAGGGFLLYAALAILGLTILGVGWRWPIMGTIYQAIGPR